jgi:hypothetical protein
MAYQEYWEGEFEEPEPEQVRPEDIGDEDREALRQDLVDVRTLKSVLGSRGIKGVVVWCPDCEDDHYLGWDLLAENLQQILQSGQPPVHEPAWEPDPEEYVTWDYARGFLDGYESYPEDGSPDGICGYCGNRLPEGGYRWAHCPTCGKELAPIKLVIELRGRGWSSERIAELLDAAGFDAPVMNPESAPPQEDER